MTTQAAYCKIVLISLPQRCTIVIDTQSFQSPLLLKFPCPCPWKLICVCVLLCVSVGSLISVSTSQEESSTNSQKDAETFYFWLVWIKLHKNVWALSELWSLYFNLPIFLFYCLILITYRCKLNIFQVLIFPIEFVIFSGQTLPNTHEVLQYYN